MKLLAVHLCISLLIIIFPRPNEPAYAGYTSMRQRGKILMMDKELVKDVHVKILAVKYLRRMYYKTTNFQLGEMYFDIRKKYKRMVILLNVSEIKDKLERIENLAECQKLQLDIDKLIHMVEEYLHASDKRSNADERTKFILRNREDSVKDMKKTKEVLKEQMSRIRNAEMRNKKQGNHLEDGFDTS